jgi:hypothetical protein
MLSLAGSPDNICLNPTKHLTLEIVVATWNGSSSSGRTESQGRQAWNPGAIPANYAVTNDGVFQTENNSRITGPV